MKLMFTNLPIHTSFLSPKKQKLIQPPLMKLILARRILLQQRFQGCILKSVEYEVVVRRRVGRREKREARRELEAVVDA
jgi:hypothetical protein